MGSGIVLGISLLCVLTTHAGALGYGTISGGWWWFFLVAIYLEAFLAVCCLLGILYGDPGVVKRTPENCLPLPEKVAKRLQRGESLEGLENLQHAQLGSYCVRCCVWRRAPGKLQSSYLPADCDMGVCEQGSHHCSTCGRCVNHFDQCALPRCRCPIAFCPIAFCPIAFCPIAIAPSPLPHRLVSPRFHVPNARARVPCATQPLRALRTLHRWAGLQRQHPLLLRGDRHGLARVRHHSGRRPHERLGVTRCLP